MNTQFFYPVTLRYDDLGEQLQDVEFKAGLPTGLGPQSPLQMTVLTTTSGVNVAGLYVWTRSRWLLAIPYEPICKAIISGSTLEVALDLIGTVDFSAQGYDVEIYKNGILLQGQTATDGTAGAVWGIRKTSTGTGEGTVKSVNNIDPDASGNVELSLGDVEDVSTTGAQNGYVLTYDAATSKWVPHPAEVAAGTVTSVNQQDPDTSGNVEITIEDNNSATGQSLIADSGATTGVMKLRTLVAGTNATITPDANGNLAINAEAVSRLQSIGSGNSLVYLTGANGGIAQVKSLAAGSNVTITPDTQGQTLTITANQVLEPATKTTIGGVIIGAGISVDGLGTIALAPPTGIEIGGVKAGTGVSIAADGTISVTAVGGVSSVDGQTGAVVVRAVDNNTATGTSLIADSGATTGDLKFLRLVAGSNVTIAPDANGNLEISSTGGVTSLATDTGSALTGAITLSAGQSISLSEAGNTIQISGTGVPEAPNDSNLYARSQLSWVAIPDASQAITSVTGQAGTGVILLVEDNPPANSAVIKSLVAGTNVTLTEDGQLVTINAQLPSGTVATVNNVAPDTNGNVAITAATLNAVPIAGNVTMTGPLSFGGQKLDGIPNPVNDDDAVNLATLKSITIDGGVLG